MTPTPSSTSSSAAAAAAASSPPQPQNNIKANEAQVTIPSSTITSAANTSPTRDGEIYKATTASSGFDEKAELEQINVLYSLLENRYTRKVRAAVSHILRLFVYEQSSFRARCLGVDL